MGGSEPCTTVGVEKGNPLREWSRAWTCLDALTDQWGLVGGPVPRKTAHEPADHHPGECLATLAYETKVYEDQQGRRLSYD